MTLLDRWLEPFMNTLRVYGPHTIKVLLSYLAYRLGRQWAPRVSIKGFSVREPWPVLRYIRELYLRGHRLLGREGDAYIVGFYGYKVLVPRGEDLGVFIEDFDEIYGLGEGYKGKRVLDIGGFLGETAMYFLYRGASAVTVYEPHPLFYETLLQNIELNGLTDRIRAKRKAICLGEDRSSLKGESVAFGLLGNGQEVEAFEVECEHAGKALSENSADIAKFNCEGCEYYLIGLDCETLRSIRHYIIEIHGSPQPLINRLAQCGFTARFRKEVDRLISVYEFSTQGNA